MAFDPRDELRTIRLVSSSGRIITIGEGSNDFVLDQDGLDLGTVGATHNATQYIDLVGQHLDSTILNPRDISVTGWIIGPDLKTIKYRKTLLNTAINPNYVIALEWGRYALDFRPDSSILYSREYNSNNGYMCKFQIQGTAHMPLWRYVDASTFREDVDKTSAFHFPLVIPKRKRALTAGDTQGGVKFGYYPYESVRNMPNEGDVASGMRIQITAGEAEAVNPGVRNLTSGKSITVKYNLQPHDSIIINTVLGEQYVHLLQGSLETNIIKYLTIESDIDMVLPLGRSHLEVFADSGGEDLQLHVEFTPRFLEVEGVV